MERFPRIVITALIVILVASCRSSNQTSRNNDVNQIKRPDPPGEVIPAGHCRMIGTVVGIEEAVMGTGDDPCSKAPCIASVRVDNIIGYGSSFGTPLSSGQVIRVRFSHTVKPSKQFFPKMLPELPGVVVGSRFQTDLGAVGPIMGDAKGPRFVVDQYIVK